MATYFDHLATGAASGNGLPSVREPFHAFSAFWTGLGRSDRLMLLILDDFRSLFALQTT